MCRFVAYIGAPLLLQDLLYLPKNSLIKQSYHALERPEPLNGDGFGVGWYDSPNDFQPCVQTYITPAWSNRNLQRLASKISAPCLFAHVRAASPGMFVTEANVHPFRFNQFLFMHNGSIANFELIKRRLRASLRDEFYNFIQGTTDSEHAFALLLNNIEKPFIETDAAEMRRAMIKTIAQIMEFLREAKVSENSYFNFALTNGREMVVSRYGSGADKVSASLHIARGRKFGVLPNGEFDMEDLKKDENASAVIISSEILTGMSEDFPDVPHNHTVTVFENLSVKTEEIRL